MIVMVRLLYLQRGNNDKDSQSCIDKVRLPVGGNLQVQYVLVGAAILVGADRCRKYSQTTLLAKMLRNGDLYYKTHTSAREEWIKLDHAPREKDGLYNSVITYAQGPVKSATVSCARVLIVRKLLSLLNVLPLTI